MRLRRLELLRYGHLADAALEFPPDTALHVVHGQNEAGKSTALSAVADALFGFGHFTKYGFQYPDQLRVGFTLSDRDGRQIALVRRKGRVNTLRDAAGEPVPDQALLAFLGGASRNLFCEEFGLNAEQLRHGSQSLLASAGNAGESILAGIGLVGLRAVQDRLDADANAQLNRGRGKIPEAVKLFQDCQKTVDECSVAPKAWQEAEAAEAAASRHLDTVRAETNALATEASRLQRLRRVRSSLQALDQNRARLAALAHLPRLPATAGPRLQAAREALQLAARDHQRETDAHRSVSDALAALPKDAAILAVQDAIDALGECRGVAVQAEADLPAVRAKVEAAKTLAVAAVAELGLSEPAEAARDKVPTAAARRTAQRLINEHSGLLATHKAASEALTAATAAHDLARDVMARTPPAEAPDLMRSTIRSVRGEGHLERALVQEDAKLARATAKVEAAHRALPLWRGDLDQLAAAPLPLPADVEAAASRIGAAQTTLAERRAAAEALTGEAAELEDKLAALASGRVVPTQDAVTAARTERAQAWHLVRQHYESGPPDLTMLDRYEAAREAADALADRRADEAALVAEHQAAATRLHRLRSREQPAAQDALGAAEGAAAAAQNGWATLWNDAGLVPGAPAAMIEWRAARAELLKLAEQAREAQATRDDIAARLATARATLGRLLPVADETLEGALLRADAALAAADAQVALARERAKALEEAKRALPSRQAGRDDAAAALHRWAAAWRDAAASLGLAPTATTEDADRALDAWARIDKAAPAWRADEARVAQMTASVAAFAADVRAVQRRVGDAETDPAPVASSRLARRLAAAREAAHAAADHAARLQEHAAAIADAASRKIAAEQELAALQELTGVAAPESRNGGRTGPHPHRRRGRNHRAPSPTRGRGGRSRRGDAPAGSRHHGR